MDMSNLGHDLSRFELYTYASLPRDLRPPETWKNWQYHQKQQQNISTNHTHTLFFPSYWPSFFPLGNLSHVDNDDGGGLAKAPERVCHQRPHLLSCFTGTRRRGEKAKNNRWQPKKGLRSEWYWELRVITFNCIDVKAECWCCSHLKISMKSRKHTTLFKPASSSS